MKAHDKEQRPLFTKTQQPVEVVSIKQPCVVQEITSVLWEWGRIWKHLYVTHSEHFETIQHRIYELIRYRSKILSGTLPVDELKEIKRLVTSKIDMGNKLLDLDMVVRDDQGNIMNPDVTSSIQLYYQHRLATERIKRETIDKICAMRTVPFIHVPVLECQLFVNPVGTKD
uniref:Dedicator of cytokinesis N-terminal domain-containing protein n=1 Tax=Timema monikensis TaxID=170555 RepID=A0A7R9HNM4_9NEOP|nr:unnamed protein product [Timema monikensis]